MKTKWLGLWKQEKPGVYAGQVIKKADIPKYTHLVMRYNKYYEAEGNRPRFVYCFVDSADYAKLCTQIDIDTDDEEEAERVFTYEEVQRMVNAAYCDGTGNDGDFGNVLVEDYL